MEEKMSFAFILFRRLDGGTTFAQSMSCQVQMGLSVSKALWPVPRKDIQVPSQVTLTGERVCSQPAPEPKAPHICADNQMSLWPVAMAYIRSSLLHVNLEQA